MVPWDVGVQGDEPDGPLVHHILDETCHRLSALGGEDVLEMGTIIVVPRNHIDRHGQRTEQIPEAFICRHAAAIYTVPGHEHDIRGCGKTAEVGDGVLEVGRCGVRVVGFSSHLGNMGVTDLGHDPHTSP